MNRADLRVVVRVDPGHLVARPLATIVDRRVTLPVIARIPVWKGMPVTPLIRLELSIVAASTVARWATSRPSVRNRLETRPVTTVDRKVILPKTVPPPGRRQKANGIQKLVS